MDGVTFRDNKYYTVQQLKQVHIGKQNLKTVMLLLFLILN